MARNATLVVKILGDASQLQGVLGKTSSSVSGFSSLASGAGKAFSAGWSLAAAGAVAFTASIFKTGVAFNSLQQNANAAFTTLLGGKTAAQAFTRELGKFADASPFPKDAFIKASQQMIAFGIDAKKVVPYLGAVQDAVAAAGGNAQQLSEVAFVMSQISAAGKITGQDLIQFGQRGINAADLIGKSMGKTGAEIKAQITAGTLPAGAALDALAKGMESSFAGAAANVKQNWSGATQAIQARLRNLGAALAEPFVSAEGGGMAVTWVNSVNSALKGLQPVFVAISGWITSAFGPTFQAVTTSLEAISSKMAGLNGQGIAGIVSNLSGLTPALGGITGALAAVSGGGLLSSLPGIGGAFSALAGPIGIVTGAIVGLIAMSPQLQQVFGSALGAAVKALAPVLPILATALGQIAAAAGTVLSALAPLIPIIAGALGQALAIVAPILAEIASAILPVFAAAISVLVPFVAQLVQAFMPLLGLLQPLISALLPPLVAILQLVLSAITPIIPVVVQLVSALVGLVVSAVTPLIPVLGKLLTAFLPILSPVLQLVGIFAQLLGALMPLLGPILQLAGLLVGKLASGIAAILGGGLRLIAPIFQGIADAISGVVGWISDLIGWFSKLKPPAWLSSIGGAVKALGGPMPSSVSYSAPTVHVGTAYGRGVGSSVYAVGLATASPQRPVQVIVQSPYRGDEIARTIRRELVKLDRRERGVVLQAVLP